MYHHTIVCDGKRPDGKACDKKVTRPSGCSHMMTLPPGWSTVVSYRKATAADVEMLKHMSPLMEAARKKEDADSDMPGAIDQMMANMVEQMPTRQETAHLCPDHELPIFRVHSGEGSEDLGFVGIVG